MPIKIERTRARVVKRAVETALAAGHAPPGKQPIGSTRAKGAISAAATALGENRATLAHLVGRDGPLEKMGLGVDWTKWAPPPAPVAPPPDDPIVVRRLADSLAREKRDRVEAERRAVSTDGLRQAVFRLAEAPLAPPSWKPRPEGATRHGEAIVLFLSDVHMGEVIDLAQMGGRNSYNAAIARARIERLFRSCVTLGTKHWSGPAPDVIYVVLGGDLVSGEIHEELAKTNDLLAIPAVRDLSQHIVAGLELLLRSFACDIRVVSVPGNHGRATKKPEAKGFALNSYDTLVAWTVEAWFAAKAEQRISFSAPASGDALVNIFGWNILFTHGDRIGSRGGQGFVGPAATAARGMKKLVQDYAAEGVIVDAIVMGHLHTALELEEGFVNGSLGGPSEYSRSGRFRSAPASQWMLTVHPERGIARRWKIQVGDPSEGSLYKGKAP